MKFKQSRKRTTLLKFGIILAILLGSASAVYLRELIESDVTSTRTSSGCCSQHGGVCGCRCCDGTALSKICQERMPNCSTTSPANQDKVSEFSGKVIKVSDGDTLDVLYENRAIRIRLAEIDCPEKKQPFGEKARRYAAELAAGREVTVKVKDRDRYGRIVAEIILPDNRSLNAEMLKAGFAWWYRDYSKDKNLEELERKAVEAKIGLWADPDPVPPWVFRRKK